MLEHIKRMIIGALTLAAIFSPFMMVTVNWGVEAVGWIVVLFGCYVIGAMLWHLGQRGDRP